MSLIRLLFLVSLLASVAVVSDEGVGLDPNGATTDGGPVMDPNGGQACYSACVDPNG